MSNCAASVMDRTQDSGSCNVGSTPTWRIVSIGDYKGLPLTKQLLANSNVLKIRPASFTIILKVAIYYCFYSSPQR